jgi:tRNA(Ile)-lysidine synthase
MPEKEESFLNKVAIALQKIGVTTGTRICIGSSGGPDSSSLLYALSSLSYTFDFTLFAAYIDHGLRSEIEIGNEIDFLKRCTAELNIRFLIKRIPHGEIEQQSKEKRRSIEETAREKRYSLLHSVKDEVNAEFIALGHTADDNIETIVMRFFQGSDFPALSGIPESRGVFIRPILSCTKKEVFEYLHSIGAEYKSDSSNKDVRFLRNSVRNNLMPVISDAFPGFEKSLRTISKKAGLFRDFIDRDVANRLLWIRDGTGYSIRFDQFKNEHAYVRLFSFLKIYDKIIEEFLPEKRRRLPYGFVSPILDDERIARGSVLLCGHGITLKKRGDHLFCKIRIVEHKKKGYLITIEKKKKIALHGIKRVIQINDGNPDERQTDASDYILRISEERVIFPLVMRSRKAGDRIAIAGGYKTLKKLFNEWKVPESKRWMIPVITDREKIIAVLGKPFGFRNKDAFYGKKDLQSGMEKVIIHFIEEGVQKVAHE